MQLAKLSVHAASGRRQQRVFCCIAASLAEPCMAAAEASSLELCMEASSSPQPRQCTSLSPSWLWWSSALSSHRACSSARPGARTSVTPPSTGPVAAASTTHVSKDLTSCPAKQYCQTVSFWFPNKLFRSPRPCPLACFDACNPTSEAVSGAGSVKRTACSSVLYSQC